MARSGGQPSGHEQNWWHSSVPASSISGTKPATEWWRVPEVLRGVGKRYSEMWQSGSISDQCPPITAGRSSLS